MNINVYARILVGVVHMIGSLSPCECYISIQIPVKCISLVFEYSNLIVLAFGFCGFRQIATVNINIK
ncbi:hypothetical protein VNO78_05044 [Psophocarpus tetragonolobus]|uniref:Uncharacterized protein n=1 Tax=Psophocarpus tetragonolobus TaxID=3891 RepID=A0AAN9ST87_PSOTE